MYNNVFEIFQSNKPRLSWGKSHVTEGVLQDVVKQIWSPWTFMWESRRYYLRAKMTFNEIFHKTL